MEKIVRTFDSSEQVVQYLAESLFQLSQSGAPVHIALSGGSTPKSLFNYISSSDYLSKICWEMVHVWWGDERLVSPDNDESNFGQAHQLLLKHSSIPSENIHRIKGELSQEQALSEFESELSSHMPPTNEVVFDWVMLGVGEDGHTASLFPGQTDYDSPSKAVLVKHPESGQVRVSLTASAIKNAKKVSYLVLGQSKAKIVKDILEKKGDWRSYPAARIESSNGVTEWCLDAGSANLLDETQ